MVVRDLLHLLLRAPLFVVDVRPETNTVVAGPPESLMADGLVAGGLCWVSGRAPEGPVRLQVRIRYRGEPAPATVEVRGDTAHVRFGRPQRAVTPGQAVVFYDGERVIGGGTIEGRDKATKQRSNEASASPA